MTRLPQFIENVQGKLWLTEDEDHNLEIRYHIKEVLFEEQSKYQHVMVLDSYTFGPMLVLDGIVQTTSRDGFIYNEMISHVPLAYHPNPRNVLIIGGGDLGAAREAAKHEKVERVDLIEIDETVVRASQLHMPEVSGGTEISPKIRIHYRDGVEYVKNLKAEYDVIIVDSSDPIGPAVELFSEAFYQNVHRALKDDGIMTCQSESPIFYQDIMAKSYNRIAGIFPHTKMYTAVVPTYPGGFWTFTLGAKQALPDPEQVRFDIDARYANEEVIRGCFSLPTFIKKQLEK
ncbi:spermidine synthase [Insulibacter thermoxylanivorax]|uniref:Polyamine aminopropyltransferase n=1 Tax=Insulibacter thermoxylanivorax TaxID=2749268 RepID=A0A916QE06_9BACL|nr:polyamine aminopropyltransferase [Insulibacter thermoxylanivorax]GFR37859.1 spermidine synthase [Insulibacter thermoxylanivorax]